MSRYGVIRPLDLIRYSKGLIMRTLEGLIRLFKDLIRPLKVLIRSFRGLIRPFEGTPYKTW